TSQVNSAQIKSILTQIANPGAAATAGASSVVNREKLSKMNETLTKSRQEGNTLAASILSVNAKTSDTEIAKLQERIRDAREKGEPVGIQLAELTEKKESVPLVNRVQTVSKEDYEAVKQMWKENYKNLEVPEGMAGTREEWVKDDISKIDGIVEKFNSHDEEKIGQAMEDVSSILPFLLVGGFSQAEITSYLKAKQEAAKEVSQELAQEEEDKVSISVKKTATASQTMSASIPEDAGDDTGEESDLSNLPASKKTITIPQVSTQILQMTNLQLPKLTDIVKYEVRSLTKDKTESERIEKIQTVLEKIGNPTSITTPAERTQYENLREKLGQESLSGNVTANVVLAAVAQVNGAITSVNASLSEIKTMLTQIANPQAVQTADDRDYYTRLHEYLQTEIKEKNSALAQQIANVNEATDISVIQNIKDKLISSTSTVSVLPQVSSALTDLSGINQLKSVIKQIAAPTLPATSSAAISKIRTSVDEAKKKGDALATEIVSVNDKTSVIELKKLKQKLTQAGNSGNPIAKAILTEVSGNAELANTNRLQEIKPEDYQEAKELWKKAYMQYFVPQGFTEDVKGRIEWISNDIKDISETIELISSVDEEKKNSGIKKVSNILPFLLLGGFSYIEMIKYLQTKLEAGKEALVSINDEEDRSVEVNVKKEEKPQEMQAKNDAENEKEIN
ncbi:MAG TPA: hypothetical protein VLG67_00910, partial [Candidatus Saccharimonadales bacterium]|nr:hypothetical protein [Candidatus Saccharimonadales bacterium]